MRTTEPALGICKSARCIENGRGPVELYDGPGKFCPDCGEGLQRYEPEHAARSWAYQRAEPPPSAPAPPPSAAPPPPGPAAPSPSATAPPGAAATTPGAAAPPPAAASPAPAPASRGGNGRRALVALAVLAAAAAGGLGVAHAVGSAPAQTSAAVGVCGSSMTNQLAGDVLHDFVTQHPAFADRFALRGTGCDVAFFATLHAPMQRSAGLGMHGALAHALGHDAVVAVVNPLNPLGDLSLEQLRGVLTGTIHDWSALHGPPAPMTVYLPADGSDEANTASALILQHAPIGSAVVRVPTSADVVRAVAAANGRDAIGIAAFSAAVPAKVVALDGSPPPSSISIADGRYPLALDVTVAAWNPHDAAIPTLMAYASSDSVRSIVSRDRIVP